MAKRSRRDEDVVEEKVFAAVAEIDDAIAKLRRRFDEVRALDGRTFAYDDPRVASAERNISDTVLSIYGPKSPEYRRFSSYQIWYGPMALNMSKAELHRGFALGLPHAREDLENLIRGLEEKKADLAGDTTARVRSAFEGLDLHPRIAAVSTDLYRDGHYRNAVLDASVALVNLVREKSRRHDLDGSGLMSTVFSKNNPILAFNALRDRTDEDEQEGMMHLLMGAVMAVRNPRAHALIADSPETALEYLALVSLLAKRVDQATRVAPP